VNDQGAGGARSGRCNNYSRHTAERGTRPHCRQLRDRVRNVRLSSRETLNNTIGRSPLLRIGSRSAHSNEANVVAAYLDPFFAASAAFFSSARVPLSYGRATGGNNGDLDVELHGAR
jgi:hypothetical protein